MTPEENMRQHARSFAPAARLLGRNDRSHVARLYALCRTVDDLADTVGGPYVRARLVELSKDLSRPQRDDPLAEEARDLFAGDETGLAAFRQLVATVANDTGPFEMADDAALDRYCMGVAGTVGIMICVLFDVKTHWHAAASDLGKAMQLTNICRDVRADAEAGRRYLPATLCPHSPEAIAGGDPNAARAVQAAVATLLTRADALYWSGRAGLPALPPRLRLAVAAASELYAGIGDELRARDCDALSGRVVVPRHRKTRLFVTAVVSQLRLGVVQRPEVSHAAT